MTDCEREPIQLLLADGSMSVDYNLAEMSGAIRDTFNEQNMVGNNNFPLPNVTKEVMCKVLEHCEYHLNNEKEADNVVENDDNAEKEPNLDDFCKWDLDYAASMHPRLAIECVKAADFLELLDLRSLLCRDIAARIMNLKTPAEIREKLCIESDMTLEEEERLRKEVMEKYMQDEKDSDEEESDE